MKDTERDAFEGFVRSSGDRLLRLATLLSAGDTHAAQDLVQQALARVAQRWRRLEGPPEAYAKAVLLNLSTDRWRRSQVRVREAVGLLPDRADSRSDGALHTVELRLVLTDLLVALPPRQRAVVVLRFWDDLSEAQIASALGIRPGTVKSTCASALAALRAHLVWWLDPLSRWLLEEAWDGEVSSTWLSWSINTPPPAASLAQGEVLKNAQSIVID